MAATTGELDSNSAVEQDNEQVEQYNKNMTAINNNEKGRAIPGVPKWISEPGSARIRYFCTSMIQIHVLIRIWEQVWIQILPLSEL